jgi:hypothetical protein
VPWLCQQMALITNTTCQTRTMKTLKGDTREQTKTFKKQSSMKVDLCQWVEVNSFAPPLGRQASFKLMVLQGRKELGNVVLLHRVCAYRNWWRPAPSLAIHNNWARRNHVNCWSILDLTVMRNKVINVEFAKQTNVTPQWMQTGQCQIMVPAWYKRYCTAGGRKLLYHATRTTCIRYGSEAPTIPYHAWGVYWSTCIWGIGVWYSWLKLWAEVAFRVRLWVQVLQKSQKHINSWTYSRTLSTRG